MSPVSGGFPSYYYSFPPEANPFKSFNRRRRNKMDEKNALVIDTERKANGLSKKDNLYIPNKDLIIKGDFFLNTHITCRDLISVNSSRIMTKNILARDIKVNSLFALNINSRSISCGHLYVDGHIRTGNIRAISIIARNIEAKKIDYNIICFSYYDIVCKEIVGNTLEESNHFSIFI